MPLSNKNIAPYEKEMLAKYFVPLNTAAIRYKDFMVVMKDMSYDWYASENKFVAQSGKPKKTKLVKKLFEFTKLELGEIHPDLPIKLSYYTQPPGNTIGWSKIRKWLDFMECTLTYLFTMENELYFLRAIDSIRNIDLGAEEVVLSTDRFVLLKDETGDGDPSEIVTSWDDVVFTFEHINELYPGFTTRALLALDLGLSGEEAAKRATTLNAATTSEMLELPDLLDVKA